MGIPQATAEFLIQAAQRGVRFDRTLTIGRQQLMVGPWRLARLLSEAGKLPWGKHELYRDLAADLWFADPLFRALGARDLASLDVSGYEGSTILWDLNVPVPDELHERFDVVFDGGSLEHVFHAPTALASYMRMTRVGGHLILTVPGNNLFGHGLYQFSPDFFYASLCADNGFVVEELLAIVEDVDAPARLLGARIGVERRGPAYRVANPADAGARVQLVNRRPVMLLVRARRTDRRVVFADAPQQSDYVSRWDAFDAAGPPSRSSRVGARAERLLSPRAQLHLLLDVLPRLAPAFDPLRARREARRRSFRNRRHFRR